MLALGAWLVLLKELTPGAISNLPAEMPKGHLPTELPVPEDYLFVVGGTVAFNKCNKSILYQISFYLAAGETVGVIDHGSSGKNTVPRVLTGLVKSNVGEVRLGSATLSQYGLRMLGLRIGY